MRLFDKIATKLNERKLDSFLSNSLYGLLDRFVTIEENVTKGALQPDEAIDFLRRVCQDVKNDLLSVKELSEKVFNKYEKNFKVHLLLVEKYINSLSVHHL